LSENFVRKCNDKGATSVGNLITLSDS